MRKIIPILCFILGACQNAGQKAEAEYEIYSKVSHHAAERCEKQHAVADAWLSVQNEQKYKEWMDKASEACLDASLVPGY